ncbi:30S ribosomal protein S8 [Pontiella sulfatireligans]|uniref:Small ribosomal subunit protein uS8 n=1 Tax=Pontiella sulfatireligans TaxID=2750658 RepID=A0A6C2UKA7_9BACT|nr:30S ribosomal protein S8 [Pontiella sulfatireligans]VGO20538.1 30S ribosomal protein S8 [Pontiella sulfatireligans]
MVLTDPIADMLTRIRNANMAEKKVVAMPHSKMKSELARILKSEGFIKDYTMENDDGKSVLNLFLKYTADREPVIQGLRRISKPSCRKYVNSEEVPRVLGGIGVAILSTSSGVMTDTDAREKKIGGEVLCYIW